MSSGFLALAWLGSDRFRHLGSKLVNGRSFFVSAIEINVKNLKKQTSKDEMLLVVPASHMEVSGLVSPLLPVLSFLFMHILRGTK